MIIKKYILYFIPGLTLSYIHMQEHSTKVNLISKLEKLKKESIVREKSLNIVDNHEIIVKLKKKVEGSSEKLKRMNYKWNKYETEQKLILSELNEEKNKKHVSMLNYIFYRTNHCASIFQNAKNIIVSV